MDIGQLHSAVSSKTFFRKYHLKMEIDCMQIALQQGPSIMWYFYAEHKVAACVDLHYLGQKPRLQHAYNFSIYLGLFSWSVYATE